MNSLENETGAVAEIKELFQSWVSAVKNGNIETIIAHHTSDIVMFDVPPPFQSKGLEEYKNTWGTFFSWSVEPRIFEFTELKIYAGETVAFCHAVGHCSGTDSKGIHEKLLFRLTMGFQKINNEWQITHEHHSVPNEAP